MTQKESEGNNTKYKDGVNQNARLIVRNISFKATEEDFRNHFSSYGDVEEVKLLKNKDGRLVGCGFVHYTHVPMANKALAATNKKPFLGRPINVAWAVSKEKYLEKLQTNPNKKFSSGVIQPMETENENSEKKETKQVEKQKPRVNRNARLVVRNISFKATEESMKEHFAPYGELLEVNLLKKPDGKLVGCAFILYKTVPMAKKALLNTNMKPFLGRPISVDWAVAKNMYMQHIVQKETELQSQVKKEESDSDDDDDKPPINISGDDLKKEVKSESDESDSDKDSESEQFDDESDKSDGDEDSDDDEDVDDEEAGDDDDDVKETSIVNKRVQLNDAEDGCTVFVSNLPFEIDNDRLLLFAQQHGLVKYALVCLDKLTEHSKGSGFVKFVTKEDADKFLQLSQEERRLEGQVLQLKPALKRESLQKNNDKQPKDNRNLYLVKEGVVVAGTKAAVGVSASDMAKRLALERSKTQMLKNLNRFVSRYRLVVSNLPTNYDDGRLRKLCVDAATRGAVITEARVMRDLRAPVLNDGRHPSKGYGFVMFMKHEDALMCLRKLNNNPDVFDKNNRPIVSFSIEDRTALNARKKRLEKSIANNPQANNNDTNESEGNNRNKNRKRKNAMPDETTGKKGNFKNDNWQQNSNKHGNNKFGNQQNKFGDQRNKFGEQNNKGGQDNKFGGQNNKFGGQNNKFGEQNNKFDGQNNKFDGQNNKFGGQNNRFGGRNGRQNRFGNRQNDREESSGNFVRKPVEYDEYTGLTAKEGSQHKMRSNHKLRMQADVHRQTVKAEKKTNKRTQILKMAAKERVKQPKQKVNKKPKKGDKDFSEKKINAIVKNSGNFTDLVSKYKSKLTGNNLVKSKWYDN